MYKKIMEIKGAMRTPKYIKVDDAPITLKKGNKEIALEKATITISTGKTFYADTASKLDMLTALFLASSQGFTETQWKLAEPYEGGKWSTVTINEMVEATLGGLQFKGEVIA